MGQIPQNLIERVRETSDIVDIISRYVDLKQRGLNFFGLCPFHSEKTPSFSVAPSKQIYHCFGCNNGGNVFSFIMEYQKVSFPEAVKSIADYYNIPIQLDKENIKTELFSSLYEIHELAVKFYHNNLFSQNGSEALSYLHNRGLKDDIIKKFKIGYSNKSWDKLILHCKGKGFTKSQILKSGLFTHSDKGIFDRFRHRIMFPIFHSSGRPIAFGGRTLDQNEPAKYLNSPETPLYKKRNVLYGTHIVRDAVLRSKHVVLVEGYMDFLKLYQNGIKSVLALSGTSLTELQVTVISRMAQKVILLYDGDNAGCNAAIRAGWIIIKGGLEPLVIQPPEGMDPDEWIDKVGKENISQKINSPDSYLDFHLNFSNSSKLKGVDRKNYIVDMAKELKGVEDGIIRNEMIRVIAKKLKIEEEDLIRVVKTQKVIKSYANQNEMQETPLLFSGRLDKAQLELVRILAGENEKIKKYLIENVSVDDFPTPMLKKLATYLLDENLILDSSSIIEYFQDSKERDYVAKILFDEFDNIYSEEIVNDCLKILKSEPIKTQINDLRIKIREKESRGEDLKEELNEINSLRKILNDL